MKKCKISDKIIRGMFFISKKPVLFRDLLEANASFNEGMLVDPAKLNFKFRYGKSYIIFGLLCLIILIPFLILTHGIFEKINFHISIIATIFITSCIFIGFDIFKAIARKYLTKKLIQEAWAIHFPFFPYEKYSSKVEEIYDEAIKKEISKRELEQYVLDKLVTNS
ncbi:hypothetical protein F1B92_03560 [Campylobacter sp. FMV-PI01]|uniref:Uncharacterized protein n=1 Tax=Campylobacter portucalensis TaxID=2608384 RepID=A0A6L5WJ33_9BACT|nr:hypothetical protein [Campylobacter portucalensis]MSN96277.1 hypothetical protein [Campylobacter portucalensis]